MRAQAGGTSFPSGLNMGSRKRHIRSNAANGGSRRPRGGATPALPAWAAAGLLFLAAVAVYLPVLGAQFVWDDDFSIADNPLLRGWGGLWRIWTTIGQIPREMHYWPLTYSVLWLQWQCWSDWAAGYHLVNAVLHGAIVVQVWRLMRRIGLPGGWLAALLFALHPVHVEAVAWVISLKDLLATLAGLLAVEFYLNHEERGGGKWLGTAAAAMAAAMLCKSMPVALPAGLALLAWYRRGRLERRELAALALLGAITLAIGLADTWVTHLVPRTDEVIAPALPQRLAQAGLRFWLYLWKLVWPGGLSPIYPQWALDPHRTIAWLPLAGIAAATVGLWAARRRIGRGPLACWLFYGVMLGPVLGVIHFSFLRISPIADRYQYLASLGPIVGAGVVGGRWLARGGTRGLGVAALLLALAALTWRYERQYHDDATLFGHAMTMAPDSADAPYNLGVYQMKQGRHAEAIALFERAGRINPEDWRSVCNIIYILMSQGRDRDAADLCRDAIRRGARNMGIVNNLALLLITTQDAGLRDPAEALKVMQHEPEAAWLGDPAYLGILAQVQLANGLSADALATAQQAQVKARETGMDQVAAALDETIREARRQGGPKNENKK